MLLDSEDPTFYREFKKKLVSRICKDFGIDVEEDGIDMMARRQDAFLLCRSSLIRSKGIPGS